MGIKEFWTTIDAADVVETVSIAELAAKHFATTGLPYRIAVDQANWWFKALADKLEVQIRKHSPHSNPREKRMLERIFHLLSLNIQLVFVFDGPDKDKPARGGNVGVVNAERVQLLRRMLEYLGVPQHDAPGDAEAECARLQSIGTVDSVWSDDSDAFMFGCRTLIRFHRNSDSTKHSDLVDVYRMETIQQRTGLSREGIIMFAVLVGNDFDEKGLPGCGKAMALTLAREQGLVKNLLDTEEDRGLSRWRAQLSNAIMKIQPNFGFKDYRQFPRFTAFTACKSPNVSANAVLSPPKFPRNGWFRSFRRGPQEMEDLYRFLLSHFNSRLNRNWPAKYLVPIELNHLLARSSPEQRPAELHLGVRKKRKTQSEYTTTVTVEDPLLLLPELGHAFGISELEGHLVFAPIEFDLLHCVLPAALSETNRGTGKRQSLAPTARRTKSCTTKQAKNKTDDVPPQTGKLHPGLPELDLSHQTPPCPTRKRKSSSPAPANKTVSLVEKKSKCGSQDDPIFLD